MGKFVELCGYYDTNVRPRLDEVRAGLAKDGRDRPAPDVDEGLEAQVRVFFLDRFLALLNWNLGNSEGPLTIVPEAAVDSLGGTRRFLDYFGIEEQTRVPLFILEAKRPSSRLPLSDKPKKRSRFAFADDPPVPYSAVIAEGLRSGTLVGDWKEWLEDLRAYCSDVKARTGVVPQRVAISNGIWIVVFLDPADALLPGGTADPARIWVFEDWQQIRDRYIEVYNSLDYNRIAEAREPFHPATVLFHIPPDEITGWMHGILVKRIIAQTIFSARPELVAVPLIFLRGKHGRWIRIWGQREVDIPPREELLEKHLNEIACAADQLRSEIQQRYPSAPLITLQEHYADVQSFVLSPAIQVRSTNEFAIMTGFDTHFICSASRFPDCPYHDWLAAHDNHVAYDGPPISKPSVNPASYFGSGTMQHCAHSDVNRLKSSATTPAIGTLARSFESGAAFCEIWAFEQLLCCKTCVFEIACSRATVFILPCPTVSNPAPAE